MITTLHMSHVSTYTEPHPSHEFGRKVSTAVSCASDDRFGSVRSCKKCNGQEVWAGAHYLDARLLDPCKVR